MKITRRPHRLLAAGALFGVVVLAAACDPGWTNPSLGTGDGSGSVPGSVAVSAVDTAVSQASVTLDLGARGYLTYDEATCRIYRTAGEATTLFAGNGICGSSGDGGPATEASIQLFIPPIGTGMQVDGSGDVSFTAASPNTADSDLSVRTIDPRGVITSVQIPRDPDAIVSQAVPDGNGGVDYLRVVFAGSGGVPVVSAYEIHDLAADGTDHLEATWSGRGVGRSPQGFVKLGPDHWVVLGVSDQESNDGGQTLVDFDRGTVTTTDLTKARDVADDSIIVVDGADTSGDLYGVTADAMTTDDAFVGNRVVRIAPDGTVEVIAGSGTPDPGTSRQQGRGGSLNLSAHAVSVTDGGNLLISSGHVVYRLIDAAHAPAIDADAS